MSSEEEPDFSKPKIASIIILSGMIAALILHRVLWEYADWTLTFFFVRERRAMLGLGVLIPACVLALTIVGPKIYDKSEYISLIFGIALIAIGGILIIVTAVQIVNNIGDLIDKLGNVPNVTGFYITYIIIAIAGAGLSVLILLGGIDLIKYYNTTNL
ncbi:MAG: hypothetical protein HWN66_02850 [Candidatus Helarchaeota archaeon]|nr:hypothetical protein [Candidatus Helarchaeota archaeon]